MKMRRDGADGALDVLHWPSETPQDADRAHLRRPRRGRAPPREPPPPGDRGDQLGAARSRLRTNLVSSDPASTTESWSSDRQRSAWPDYCSPEVILETSARAFFRLQRWTRWSHVNQLRLLLEASWLTLVALVPAPAKQTSDKDSAPRISSLQGNMEGTRARPRASTRGSPLAV